MGGILEGVAIGVITAAVVAGSAATSKRVRARVGRAWTAHKTKSGKLPDHVTITSGWYGAPSASSSGAAFRVMVACAPSTQHSPTVVAKTRLDADRVQALVTATFRDVVDAEPEFRNVNEVVRYRGALPSSPSEASAVLVWATGLIEACVSIPFEVDGDQSCSILLDDFVRAALPLIAAVSSGAYRRVFGGAGRERLDWRISISDGVTPSSWMALRSFRFGGHAPLSGPATSRIAAPERGFAVDALRSRSQADDPAALLRPVLVDMLDRGGYVDYEDALVDLLKLA